MVKNLGSRADKDDDSDDDDNNDSDESRDGGSNETAASDTTDKSSEKEASDQSSSTEAPQSVDAEAEAEQYLLSKEQQEQGVAEATAAAIKVPGRQEQVWPKMINCSLCGSCLCQASESAVILQRAV